MIDLCIMAVPSRFALVKALLPRVGPARVFVDNHRRGPWPTARACWRAEPLPGTTHRLILQDDVLVCDGFRAAAEAALSAVPDQPVSFFANRSIIAKAAERGDRWAVVADGIWGQAMCLPHALVPAFLRWEWGRILSYFKHDDERLALWCLETRRPAWCTVPSLVEHGQPHASTLGHKTPQARTATLFLGEGTDGSGIDWTPPTAPLTESNRSLLTKYARFMTVGKD